MTDQPLRKLYAVLTSFAFRDEYFPKLSGMLVTLKENYPDWPLVIGQGALIDGQIARFDVETGAGQYQWTLPVPFRLEGGEDDWRKITRMKGWWLYQVWSQIAKPNNSSRNRIIWLDADARLNAALDIEFDPEAEIIAGPWWHDPNNSAYDTITSGLLLFQGAAQGLVAEILRLWSQACLKRIKDLSPQAGLGLKAIRGC